MSQRGGHFELPKQLLCANISSSCNRLFSQSYQGPFRIRQRAVPSRTCPITEHQQEGYILLKDQHLEPHVCFLQPKHCYTHLLLAQIAAVCVVFLIILVQAAIRHMFSSFNSTHMGPSTVHDSCLGKWQIPLAVPKQLREGGNKYLQGGIQRQSPPS